MRLLTKLIDFVSKSHLKFTFFLVSYGSNDATARLFPCPKDRVHAIPLFLNPARELPMKYPLSSSLFIILCVCREFFSVIGLVEIFWTRSHLIYKVTEQYFPKRNLEIGFFIQNGSKWPKKWSFKSILKNRRVEFVWFFAWSYSNKVLNLTQFIILGKNLVFDFFEPKGVIVGPKWGFSSFMKNWHSKFFWFFCK